MTDLCEIRQRNPTLTNIYAELGSTFGMTVITSPLLCGHILGMLVQHLGADHVLWGTDSIWWGSPRWQIEALRRFTMPETLITRFGYAPLTPDVKARSSGSTPLGSSASIRPRTATRCRATTSRGCAPPTATRARAQLDPVRLGAGGLKCVARRAAPARR